MKLIFLDIDGVLNGHQYNGLAGSCRLDPACCGQFNRIIEATDAKVVISSAWRYMVSSTGAYQAAMTIKGFEYLLRTHWLNVADRLIGVTLLDEIIPTRGAQIADYLQGMPVRPDRYVVIDDGRFDIPDYGHHLVMTDDKVGLTERDADVVIDWLNCGGSDA